MARHGRTPELNDVVTIFSKTYKMQLIGTVKDLLNIQFIISVTNPEHLQGKDYFIHNNDQWILLTNNPDTNTIMSFK